MATCVAAGATTEEQTERNDGKVVDIVIRSAWPGLFGDKSPSIGIGLWFPVSLSAPPCYRVCTVTRPSEGKRTGLVFAVRNSPNAIDAYEDFVSRSRRRPRRGFRAFPGATASLLSHAQPFRTLADWTTAEITPCSTYSVAVVSPTTGNKSLSGRIFTRTCRRWMVSRKDFVVTFKTHGQGLLFFPGEPCHPYEPFKCPGDGACISIQYLCDGANDCPDGYDEDPRLCTAGNRNVKKKQTRKPHS